MFGKNIISSSTGFHQGDPLAGLLFFLNLQPVVEQVKVEVPDLDLKVWFLDDGTQVGTLEHLQRVVSVLQREGQPMASTSLLPPQCHGDPILSLLFGVLMVRCRMRTPWPGAFQGSRRGG